jgi:nickel/cobalt transporter (NicO) family protein
VTPRTLRARRVSLTGLTLVLVGLLFSVLPLLSSFAQTPPAQPAPQQAPVPKSFLKGAAPMAPVATGPIDRLYQWVTVQQQAINRSLAEAIKNLKAGGGFGAALTLGALSFMYGILHAVGPGHGKAVISAYVLADRQTLRRGVMLSFLSALVQALMALMVVAVLKLVLNAAGKQATALTELWLERASWAFVTLFGAWLLYRQFAAYRAQPVPEAHLHHHVAHDHGHHDHTTHDHGHAHHAHDHKHVQVHDHHTGHHHASGDVCDTCGHAHMPSPEALQKDWSLGRMMTLAFAIGIRPCTGAILVLIFAISQGLLWAGVFATFAMAIGTAITVSILAAMAVGSRGFAERYAATSGAGWITKLQPIVSTSAAALVMVLGATFFYYSLVSPTAF